MTPQRPYTVAPTSARRSLRFRHGNGRMDATVRTEPFRRPFGATPRVAKDWR